MRRVCGGVVKQKVFIVAACMWRGGQEGVYDCNVCGGVVRQGLFMIAACMWRGGQAGSVYDCGVYVEGWSGRGCL